MRKIFLTSGLVVCMACPAFADLTAPTQTYPNGTVSGSNPVAEPTCQEPTLGGYSGTSTFNAIWTKNKYDVTYAPGTHGTGGQTLANAAEYDTNYTIRGLGSDTSTTSGVTANTGYTFTGWYGESIDNGNGADATYNALPNADPTNPDRSYTETETISPYTIAGDLTLTAQWRHNTATITLNSSIYTGNTISGNPKYNQDTQADGITKANPSTVYSGYNIGLFSSQQLATEGQETDTYNGSNASHKVGIPSRTGYTFDGFFDTSATPVQMITNEGVQTNAAKTAVSTDGGSATWYAHWTPRNFTITYTCGTKPTGASTDFTNGHTTTGDSANDTDSVTFDTNYTLNADAGNCVLPGYHFVGWSCENLPGTPTLPAGEGVAHTYFAASASDIYDYDENVTCNAVWEANNITTSWNLQNGSATTAGGQSCTYDGTISLPQNVTRTGYTFGGWTVTNTPASN